MLPLLMMFSVTEGFMHRVPNRRTARCRAAGLAVPIMAGTDFIEKGLHVAVRD
jgi:hypothetical protein